MTAPHEAYAAEQAAEYGQYEAAETIWIGGSRAFNVGDRVPAAHVKNGVVTSSQVTRLANKTEAKAAAEKDVS